MQHRFHYKETQTATALTANGVAAERFNIPDPNPNFPGQALGVGALGIGYVFTPSGKEEIEIKLGAPSRTEAAPDITEYVGAYRKAIHARLGQVIQPQTSRKLDLSCAVIRIAGKTLAEVAGALEEDKLAPAGLAELARQFEQSEQRKKIKGEISWKRG